jgi:hypothetical protein
MIFLSTTLDAGRIFGFSTELGGGRGLKNYEKYLWGINSLPDTGGIIG